MYYYAYLFYFIVDSLDEIKIRTNSCLISLVWIRYSLLLSRAISLVIWTCEIAQHKDNLCSPKHDDKHSLVLVTYFMKTPNFTKHYIL